MQIFRVWNRNKQHAGIIAESNKSAEEIAQKLGHVRGQAVRIDPHSYGIDDDKILLSLNESGRVARVIGPVDENLAKDPLFAYDKLSGWIIRKV